jgi:hypothetical protein
MELPNSSCPAGLKQSRRHVTTDLHTYVQHPLAQADQSCPETSERLGKSLMKNDEKAKTKQLLEELKMI